MDLLRVPQRGRPIEPLLGSPHQSDRVGCVLLAVAGVAPPALGRDRMRADPRPPCSRAIEDSDESPEGGFRLGSPPSRAGVPESRISSGPAIPDGSMKPDSNTGIARLPRPPGPRPLRSGEIGRPAPRVAAARHPLESLFSSRDAPSDAPWGAPSDAHGRRPRPSSRRRPAPATCSAPCRPSCECSPRWPRGERRPAPS